MPTLYKTCFSSLLKTCPPSSFSSSTLEQCGILAKDARDAPVSTWSSIPSCVLVIERPWARINHITWRGFPGCSGIINGPLEMPLTQSTLGGVLGSTPSPALGSLAAVPLNYKCSISSHPHLGWDHPNISHHHSSLPLSFMGTVTGCSSCLYLAISSLHSSQCNLFF